MNIDKKYLISFTLFLLTVIGGFTWKLIEKGGEAEFNEKVEAIIQKKMSDSKLINTLLKSEQVEKFKEEAGQELKNSILSLDTSKLSIPSYLGKELGIRDEDVLPFLAEFMRQVKEGKIATKEDIRPRRSPVSEPF